LSFLFVVAVCALELLIAALQAYVFALLTTLYLNDAVNLH
jgi:F-type H+-transporting ATPase subunit a